MEAMRAQGRTCVLSWQVKAVERQVVSVGRGEFGVFSRLSEIEKGR